MGCICLLDFVQPVLQPASQLNQPHLGLYWSSVSSSCYTGLCEYRRPASALLKNVQGIQEFWGVVCVCVCV